jgi:hypothetical protein
MSSKTKGHGNEHRGMAKEKGINVSPDSLQTRPPGSRQSGSAEVLSANKEQGNSYLRNQGPQRQFGGTEQGERGAGTAQQAGWSSRQQAQRMQARAEEERLGQPRQSPGYGGMEQDQRAGSRESQVGPSGSMQTGGAGGQQRDVNLPSAAPAGAESKRGGSGKH